MRQIARTLLLGVAVGLWASLAALAGSYTVHLEDGEALETRYPPRFGLQNVDVMNTAGRWVTLPRERVRRVTNGGPDGGLARMLDANTIDIGWTANDAPRPLMANEPVISEAVEPLLLLVAALGMSYSRPVQDFTVAQFVDPEEMAGGIPAAGLFYYDVLEDEPLEILLTLPPGRARALQGRLAEPELTRLFGGRPIEVLQGLPPGGLQRLQGVPLGGLRAIQGLPPGLRATQGFSAGPQQLAAPAGPTAGTSPGGE